MQSGRLNGPDPERDGAFLELLDEAEHHAAALLRLCDVVVRRLVG